jgi:hypothetical protein
VTIAASQSVEPCVRLATGACDLALEEDAARAT